MKILKLLSVVGAATILFGSCGTKKKCYSQGNGDTFDLILLNTDGSQITNIATRDITFYYKKTGGGTDTLTTDPDNPLNSLRAPLVAIYFEGGTSVSFMSIAGVSRNTLMNKIEGGYLYLKFPDGITDSLRLNVRNKEGCSMESLNYYIDGLIYNGEEAVFDYKASHNKIGMGTNRFKVNIH
ncbi:MAG: hypothetical protein EOP54_12885 [Sphingobacteriales bacterium]|nr:MAG: hypothetical protein EOP54_12885 [Sphingobacteriales bacterium]